VGATRVRDGRGSNVGDFVRAKVQHLQANKCGQALRQRLRVAARDAHWHSHGHVELAGERSVPAHVPDHHLVCCLELLGRRGFLREHDADAGCWGDSGFAREGGGRSCGDRSMVEEIDGRGRD
jgi:hypothetical protein